MNFLRRISITSNSDVKALKKEDIAAGGDVVTADTAQTGSVPAVASAGTIEKDAESASFVSDTSPSVSARADNAVAPHPTGVRQSRRLSLRQLNVPDDNLRMDAEFEAICRNTVASQRGAYLYHHVNSNNRLGNAAYIGGEAFIGNSATRMLKFYSGDGAAYSQYDFGRQEFSGGPLPKPWKAVRSRSTGQVYYANTETGATQWDPPLYPLSREWRIAESPQSGAVFYVHKETGRWQWERPVDELFLDLQSAGKSDQEALVAWKQRHDADCSFAGLENLRSAQPTLLALTAGAGTEADPAAPLALADTSDAGWRSSSKQSASEDDQVRALRDAVNGEQEAGSSAELAPETQSGNEDSEIRGDDADPGAEFVVASETNAASFNGNDSGADVAEPTGESALAHESDAASFDPNVIDADGADPPREPAALAHESDAASVKASAEESQVKDSLDSNS